jgi:type I restriction enzyme, S subunit
VLFAHNATVGPTALLSTELDYVILSTTATYFRCNAEKLINSFLLYVLQSAHFVGQYRAVMAQSTRNQVPITAQRKLSIILPPTKVEQEAVAETLSDADDLIESLEQLLAKKRHVKQGAMQELLTGKKRLQGFGGEWEVKRLGDLFDFSGGFSASRDQLSTDGHCYLHYGDIHKSAKTYIDVRAEHQDIPKLDMPLKRISTASLLEDGDVVFVDASEDDEGTSKHVVIVNKDKRPYISGLHTIVAKSKTDDLDHHYRRYCFQTTEIKRQFYFFAVGTKVSGISKTNIAKVTLSLPSIPEQSAIAAILSDMDTEIAALEAKLAKARNLKQGMMQELLTGRIRLV